MLKQNNLSQFYQCGKIFKTYLTKKSRLQMDAYSGIPFKQSSKTCKTMQTY